MDGKMFIGQWIKNNWEEYVNKDDNIKSSILTIYSIDSLRESAKTRKNVSSIIYNVHNNGYNKDNKAFSNELIQKTMFVPAYGNSGKIKCKTGENIYEKMKIGKGLNGNGFFVYPNHKKSKIKLSIQKCLYNVLYGERDFDNLVNKKYNDVIEEIVEDVFEQIKDIKAKEKIFIRIKFNNKDIIDKDNIDIINKEYVNNKYKHKAVKKDMCSVCYRKFDEGVIPAKNLGVPSCNNDARNGCSTLNAPPEHYYNFFGICEDCLINLRLGQYFIENFLSYRMNFQSKQIRTEIMPSFLNIDIVDDIINDNDTDKTKIDFILKKIARLEKVTKLFYNNITFDYVIFEGNSKQEYLLEEIKNCKVSKIFKMHNNLKKNNINIYYLFLDLFPNQDFETGSSQYFSLFKDLLLQRKIDKNILFENINKLIVKNVKNSNFDHRKITNYIDIYNLFCDQNCIDEKRFIKKNWNFSVDESNFDNNIEKCCYKIGQVMSLIKEKRFSKSEKYDKYKGKKKYQIYMPIEGKILNMDFINKECFDKILYELIFNYFKYYKKRNSWVEKLIFDIYVLIEDFFNNNEKMKTINSNKNYYIYLLSSLGKIYCKKQLVYDVNIEYKTLSDVKKLYIYMARVSGIVLRYVKKKEKRDLDILYTKSSHHLCKYNISLRDKKTWFEMDEILKEDIKKYYNKKSKDYRIITMLEKINILKNNNFDKIIVNEYELYNLYYIVLLKGTSFFNDF